MLLLSWVATHDSVFARTWSHGVQPMTKSTLKIWAIFEGNFFMGIWANFDVGVVMGCYS